MSYLEIISSSLECAFSLLVFATSPISRLLILAFLTSFMLYLAMHALKVLLLLPCLLKGVSDGSCWTVPNI